MGTVLQASAASAASAVRLDGKRGLLHALCVPGRGLPVELLLGHTTASSPGWPLLSRSSGTHSLFPGSLLRATQGTFIPTPHAQEGRGPRKTRGASASPALFPGLL